MRKKGRRPRPSNSVVEHPTAAPVEAVDELPRLTQILRACRKALQQTNLYQEVLVQTAVSCPKEIVCFGLGNFSQTHFVYFSPSMWQLACLLQMRDDLQARQPVEGGTIEVYFYDPVSTALETEFLTQQQQVHVLSENNQGKRKVSDGTVLFLPHCPAFLYENLLQTNPHAFEPGSKTILIGNSIHNFSNALSQPTVNIDTLRARADLLNETLLTVDSGQPGDFDKAFNDTYIIQSKGVESEAK